jgi:hypothetical protein
VSYVPDVDGSEAPPAGEEVHLPGPSILPFATAVGFTLIIIGLTTFIELTIIGVIVFLVCVFRWVSDTSRDVASLPEEHRH